VADCRAGAIWREKKIGWSRYRKQLASQTLTKSLILKAPGIDGEKVCYTCRSSTTGCGCCNISTCGGCSMNTSCRRIVVVFSRLSRALGVAHAGPDRYSCRFPSVGHELYARFRHNIRPIPILASDWINPDFYESKPHSQREIEILMVAGWSRVKRHWLLFRALRRMSRRLRSC